MGDLQSYVLRLATEPNDRSALRALESGYGRLGQWEDLLTVYQGTVLRLPKAQAIMLQHKAAMICQHQLHDTERAEGWLRSALALAPDDLALLQSLRRICEQRQANDEVVHLFERELAHTHDVAAKGMGLLQLAQIYQERLLRADLALTCLHQARRIPGSQTQSMLQEIALHIQVNRPVEAYLLLMRLLQLPVEQTTLLHLAGQIAPRLLAQPSYHDHLQSLLTSLSTMQTEQAVELYAPWQAALTAYRLHWSQRKEECLQLLADGSRPVEETAGTMCILADIEWIYGKDTAAALGWLDQSFTLLPGASRSLALLELMCTTHDLWEDYVRRLTWLAHAQQDPKLATTLLLKAAVICVAHLEHVAAGIERYREVLAIAPDNKSAMFALADLLRQQQQPQSALQELQTWAEHALHTEDQLHAYRACVRIALEDLQDNQIALKYQQLVLERDPNDYHAAAAIEPVARQQSNYALLARALEVLLEHQPQQHTMERLLELTALYEGPLQDASKAFHVWLKRYTAAPQLKDLDQLIQLAEPLGLVDEVVYPALRVLEKLPDRAARLQALHLLAAFCETTPMACALAMRLYGHILAWEEHDEAARVALVRLQQRTQQEAEQRRHLRQQLANPPDQATAIACLRQLTAPWAWEGEQLAQAIVDLQQLCQLLPQEDEIWQQLGQALLRAGKHYEHAHCLLAWSKLRQGPQRESLLLQAVNMLAQHLHREQEALQALLDAWSHLQPSLALLGALQALLPYSTHGAALSAQLADGYQALGQREWAAKMRQLQLAAATTDEDRLAILEQLAADHMALDQPWATFVAVRRMMVLNPTPERLEALLLWAEKANAQAELPVALQAAVHRTPPALAAMLWRHHAKILAATDPYGAASALLMALQATQQADESILQALRALSGSLPPGALLSLAKQVGRGLARSRATFLLRLIARSEKLMKTQEEQIAALQAVLADNPTDVEAANQLDALLLAGGDAQQQAAHLKIKWEGALEDQSRLDLGLKLASLQHEQLQDTSAAKQIYLQLGEQLPGQIIIWERLANLAQLTQDHALRADALQKQANLMPQDQGKWPLLLEVATLSLQVLQQQERGLKVLQEMLAHEPGQKDALLLLEQLVDSKLSQQERQEARRLLYAGMRASHQYGHLLQKLLAEVANESDVSVQLQLWREIATLEGEQLQNPKGAFEALQSAFLLAPEEQHIRQELARYAEKTQNYEKLAELYASAVSRLPQGDLQQQIRRQLADVLEQKLNRHEEAVEHYRALSAGGLPSDLPSLQAMERVLRQQQDKAGLAQVVLAIAQQKPAEHAERISGMLEVITILEQIPDQQSKAYDLARQLVQEVPKRQEAWRALASLARTLGHGEEVGRAFQALVELGAENNKLSDDLLALGEWALAQGQNPLAIKTFVQLLQRKKESPQALEHLEALLPELAGQDRQTVTAALEPAYLQGQMHAKLAWLLEQKMHDLTDMVARKALWRRIGDIYENRLNNHEGAFRMAAASLEEDPSDMGVRMWIEKIAGVLGNVRDLAALYCTIAARSEATLQVQFYRRAAALYHEKLQDLSNAVPQYQAILALESKDEKALSGLEVIFRQTQEYASLVDILQKRMAMTAGLERRRELLQEIVTVQMEQLSDLTGARQALQTWVDLSPDDGVAFSKLEDLLTQMEDIKGLAVFYQGQADKLQDKRSREAVQRKLQIWYKLACLQEGKLQVVEEAMALFTKILAEDPQHNQSLSYLGSRAQAGFEPAITLLDGFFRQQQQWNKLVELLNTRIELTAETAIRRALYVDLATIQESKNKDGTSAFMALAKAFSENRADVELLERLEQLAQKYTMFEELVGVIDVDLDALPDAQLRQKLLHQLGQICGSQLQRAEDAIGYYRTALQYQPSDDVALAGLQHLLQQEGLWGDLAKIIERRVELSEDVKQKSALLEELAKVWSDQIGDPEAALRCHKRILELDPEHPLTLASMEKLYREINDYDALAANLERQAQVVRDKQALVRIHQAAAELYTEELNANHKAIEHWLAALQQDNTLEDAYASLQILYTAEEKWSELADLYRNQLAVTPDAATKVDINRRLGVILGEKLGRQDDALNSWLKVLEQDAKNLDALRALMGLYSDRAMWQEFVQMTRRLIPLVAPGEAKDARLSLAKALGENLGAREDAIRLAREVRATEPHTLQQMRQLGQLLLNIQAYDEAVLALDKAAALEPDTAAKIELYYQITHLFNEKINRPLEAREAYEAILLHAPADHQAFAALSQLLRESQDWRALVACLETYLPHAPHGQRLVLLQEIRDTQDKKLGDKEISFVAAVRCFKEDVNVLASAEALIRIGCEAQMAEEVVGTLEEEMDHIIEPSLKMTLLRQLATVYEQQLQDLVSTEQTLNRLLVLAPADEEAFQQLLALAEKEERYDKQIGVLERQSEQYTDPIRKKAILLEISRIYEDKLEAIDEAVESLQAILALDGADKVALQNLVRIYERHERYRELAHVLTRQVELCQDPQENIQLRLKVAGLCEDQLQDEEAAISWYKGILEFEPGHGQTLASLERLYTGRERWSELLQVFDTQVRLNQNVTDQLALLSKMAAIYENEFESAKDAVGCFEHALQLKPDHVPTLRTLERLYRSMNDWPKLIDVMGKRVQLPEEAGSQAGLYVDMGDIYYREMSRVDKAEQMYTLAREKNPKSTAALHALGKLYERSGNWFQSLEMLQRQVDLLGKSEEALPALTRIAKINEDMLGDKDAAKKAYQQALAIDATFGPALEGLKEIARQSQDWEHYAEHVIAEAESSDDAEQKADLFAEAARFYQQVKDDEANAIRFYQRAMAVLDKHELSARALADIYFRAELWEEAFAMYECVIPHLDKSKDAKDYAQKYYRLACVQAKLNQPEQALASYREAFEADATYLPALEGLGQMLLQKQLWDEAHQVFSTILIHHRNDLTDSEVVDVQWQLGDILLQQKQLEKAFKQFEKVLEIDSHHPATLKTMAEMAYQQQDWHQAYALYGRFADVAPMEDRIPIYMKQSAIGSDMLKAPQKTIEPLEKARRLGQPTPALLQLLAQAYSRATQPARAAEMYEQILNLPLEAVERSEVAYELGQIYENLLKNDALAVQKYNDALDANPAKFVAFERIEAILGRLQAWSQIEANYRAMIERSRELNPAIRVVLWRSLASLYHKVLRQTDNAIMAYEVLQSTDGNKIEYIEPLAELYGQKPEGRSKAIEMQHQLLLQSTAPVPILKSLRKLYQLQRDFDAVYVLCSALVLLKEADEEERKLYEYLLRGVPNRAAKAMGEDQWRDVLDQALGQPIGQLCAVMYRTIPDLLTLPAKEFGLKKKDQIDVRQSELYFANIVKYVTGAFTMPAVDVYRKSDSMEPLHLVHAQPPSLVAGEANDIFRDAAQKLVMFHVARNMAYARPELFLPRMYPGSELRDMLYGLCLMYNRSLAHNGNVREVERWATTFESMLPVAQKKLQPFAQAAYPELQQGTPLMDYAVAVERVSHRLGLLACGDLLIAAKGITEGGDGAAPTPVRDRMKDLVLFATSAAYLRIRQLMGGAIPPTK